MRDGRSAFVAENTTPRRVKRHRRRPSSSEI